MRYLFLFIRSLAVFASILFVCLLDMSFFPGLGSDWATMNVTLFLAFFLVIVLRFDIAIVFMLSAYSLQLLLGGQFILLKVLLTFLTLFLLNLLLERLFTNRSYYVLLTAALAGWLFYHLVYAIIVKLLIVFTNLPLPLISWKWLGSIILFSLPLLVFCSLGYLMTSFLSQRFKSYFITANR